MRQRAIRIVFPLLVLACSVPCLAGDYGRADLTGPWNADVAAMLKAIEMPEKMPPDFNPEAIAKHISIVLTFGEDGTMTAESKTPQGEKTDVEDYEIVDQSGDVLTLKSVNEGETKTFRVSFLSKDRIRIDNDEKGRPSLEFTRGSTP